MARASVAGIRTFVEGSKRGTVHVGVDVHKRSYSVALLRSDGAWKEWAAPSSPKALESTHLPLRSRIGAVVYDAGPTGFGLARRLTRVGISVIVAAPSRVPRPDGTYFQNRPPGRSQTGRVRRLGSSASDRRPLRGGGRISRRMSLIHKRSTTGYPTTPTSCYPVPDKTSICRQATTVNSTE